MSALHVVDAAEQPTAEIYTVTPAVAARWLSRNVRNRVSRPSIVDAYARDMKAGNWQITGEAIKFDTNGALADGQHRLMAVIQADVSVPMLVVRGIAPDAQSVMDSGTKRTASDALTLDGHKNSTILAAVARLALKVPEAGFVSERVMAPTNSEIAAFIADNPDIHRAAEMAGHYYPRFDAPPSVLGACWMRFARVDAAAAALFFTSVADLLTDGPADPRHALIRRLANARRNRERLENAEYLSLIFRTWNSWRRGQSAHKLASKTRGSAIKTPGRLL
jgi:hypothetical protein